MKNEKERGWGWRSYYARGLRLSKFQATLIEALEDFTKALSLLPSEEISGKAELYYRCAKTRLSLLEQEVSPSRLSLEAVLQDVQQALSLGLTFHPEVCILFGKTWYLLAEDKAAIEWYKRALMLYPGCAEAYWGIAVSQVQLSQFFPSASRGLLMAAIQNYEEAERLFLARERGIVPERLTKLKENACQCLQCLDEAVASLTVEPEPELEAASLPAQQPIAVETPQSTMMTDLQSSDQLPAEEAIQVSPQPQMQKQVVVNVDYATSQAQTEQEREAKLVDQLLVKKPYSYPLRHENMFSVLEVDEEIKESFAQEIGSEESGGKEPAVGKKQALYFTTPSVPLPKNQERKKTAHQGRAKARRKPVSTPPRVSGLQLVALCDQPKETNPLLMPLTSLQTEVLKKLFIEDKRSYEQLYRDDEALIEARMKTEKAKIKADQTLETQAEKKQRITEEIKGEASRVIRQFVFDVRLLMLGQTTDLAREIIAERAIDAHFTRITQKIKGVPEVVLKAHLRASILYNYDEMLIAQRALGYVLQKRARRMNTRGLMSVYELLPETQAFFQSKLHELLDEDHLLLQQNFQHFWERLRASSKPYPRVVSRIAVSIPSAAVLTLLGYVLFATRWFRTEAIAVAMFCLILVAVKAQDSLVTKIATKKAFEKGAGEQEQLHRVKQLKSTKVIDADMRRVYRFFAASDRVLDKFTKEVFNGEEKNLLPQMDAKKVPLRAIFSDTLKQDLSEELYSQFKAVFQRCEKILGKNYLPKPLRKQFTGIIDTKGKILKHGKFFGESVCKIRIAESDQRVYAVEQDGQLVFSVVAKKR